MSTLKQETIFFNDAFGRIRPNAKMYFYEAGTTTPKNTFADRALEYPNPWPLVSDGAGVFPITFLGSGGYRIVYEDQDGVQFDERDDINVSDSEVSLIAATYFDTLIDLKQGISFGGLSVDLQVGQMARTSGDDAIDDNGGAEWLIVAADTGTADDDLFADLDNGLQAKKLFNQIYTNQNVDVSGYVSATTVYVNEGDMNENLFSSDIPEGAFESIGPTGSGADNIWSEMDAIPSGAKFIDLSVRCAATDASGGDANVQVNFRKTGEAISSGNAISAQAGLSSSGVTAISLIINYTYVRVPLDSNLRFDLRWSQVSGDTATVYVSIAGFGV